MRSGRPSVTEIEVKATRTFQHALHPNGIFLRGHRYQVDTDNPMVKGLIDGGYFKPAESHSATPQDEGDLDGLDLAGIDEFLGSGVGTRRTRPQKKATRQSTQRGEVIEYGQGEIEPDGDLPGGPGQDSAPGVPDGD